jgi:FkbM family methyltransferase
MPLNAASEHGCPSIRMRNEMTSTLKSPIALLRRGVRRAGWQVGLDVRVHEKAAGGAHRPLADMELFLQDVRARGFVPNCILDIGANRGDWSRLAGTVFPDAKFLLVEPQQEMESALQEFCRTHKQSSVVMAGAGASNGELVQTIWEDLAGSSFLPQADSGLIEKGEQRSVPVRTIDSILESHPQHRPDLVKIDVQGFELEVLKGAEKLFSLAELFVIEASLFEFMSGQPLVSEIVGYMRDKGFELYDVAGYMRRPFDGALGQMDLVFASSNGQLRKTSRW